MEHIISALFAARNQAHRLHLRTRSFAAHVALGELYEELVELADSLAEMYQGKYGLMEIPPLDQSLVATDDAVTFIKNFAVWAEAARSAFDPADTFILNHWDTVLSTIYSTKYKLENLQ